MADNELRREILASLLDPVYLSLPTRHTDFGDKQYSYRAVVFYEVRGERVEYYVLGCTLTKDADVSKGKYKYELEQVETEY